MQSKNSVAACVFSDEPISIELAGEKKREEWLSAQRLEHAQWQAGVVVDDERLHVHRCLPRTEMTDRGPRASNQIELLQVNSDSGPRASNQIELLQVNSDSGPRASIQIELLQVTAAHMFTITTCQCFTIAMCHCISLLRDASLSLLSCTCTHTCTTIVPRACVSATCQFRFCHVSVYRPSHLLVPLLRFTDYAPVQYVSV